MTTTNATGRLRQWIIAAILIVVGVAALAATPQYCVPNACADDNTDQCSTN